MKKFLSGNEALALGAALGGAHFGSGYPGTPSTEILEAVAAHGPRIYAEWAPNEKVGLEAAIGASLGGGRAFATMKHVGLNVAADPLMTIASCGVTGGLVVVTGDDPGAHSSQNEQDNRLLGAFAQIPVMEPANSQEACDFMAQAFEFSEKFDTPVLMRLTTRVCHGKSVVEFKEPSGAQPPLIPFERNPGKFVPVPALVRSNHVRVLERLEKLKAHAAESPLNRWEKGAGPVGFVTSGMSYNYLRELMPEAPTLKLGLTFPLNEKLVKAFAASVSRLIVIEELEPFLENQLKLMGLEVEGKKWFPPLGELTPDLVAEGLARAGVLPGAALAPKRHLPRVDMPRPPIFCAGCPHRGLFYALAKIKGVVHGDIGCYSLAFAPPLKALDTIVCMGGGFSLAHGHAKLRQHFNAQDQRPIFGVMGDSTFFHSGLTSLLNAVYNQAPLTAIILDNRITAMTGAQDNPGTGRNLKGEPAPEADIAEICRALGVKRVVEVDPYNLAQCLEVLREEAAAPEPSVVVARRACAQILKGRKINSFQIDESLCVGCGTCRKLGCPAISAAGPIPDKKLNYSAIDEFTCFGCGICAQVCPKLAIKPAGGGRE